MERQAPHASFLTRATLKLAAISTFASPACNGTTESLQPRPSQAVARAADRNIDMPQPMRITEEVRAQCREIASANALAQSRISGFRIPSAQHAAYEKGQFKECMDNKTIIER